MGAFALSVAAFGGEPDANVGDRQAKTGTAGTHVSSAATDRAFEVASSDGKSDTSVFSRFSSGKSSKSAHDEWLAKADGPAGPFDGRWTGKIVSETTSADLCGFDRGPFEIRVRNGRFIGIGRDLAEEERIFEGEVGQDGVIGSWSTWSIRYGGTMAISSAKAELAGRMVGGKFQGKLSATSGAYGGCFANIVLQREITAPFDGEWAGTLVADKNEQNYTTCGFERRPFAIRVVDGKFVARGKDASESVRTFEGEVEKDGKISKWTTWKNFMAQGSHGGTEIAHAELVGQFSGHDFRGKFFAQNNYRGSCLGKVVLRRKGAPAAVASTSGAGGDAERQRLAAEIERLKAEAERQKLEAEVARLKAAAERAKASAAPVAAKPSAEQTLWNEVRGGRSVDDVQRYLDAYPGGIYAGQARERIRQLASAEAQRQELTLWNQVKNSRDAGELRAYVKAYPDGLFIDIAEARIRSLGAVGAQTAALAETRNEARLWTAIEKSRKVQDFQDYLDRYPEGRFRTQAQARLKVLSKFAAIDGIDFGDYHALIIGNDDYKHLPDLKTAVGDASAIADALRTTYGFKIQLLTDATRGDIIDALDGYVETLTERDNLLIYYAGHGWLSEDAGRGYWLPVDAKKNRRTNWVSNATITDTLKTLQSKHVMVIADSCYSGTLTRGAGAKLRTADYWKRMAEKRTRVVLTSGGLEPVADSGGGKHSPFAQAFMDVLDSNDAVMDGTHLFTKMRRPVMVAADQTPEYSDARNAGHEGGDFLFVRKR